MNNEIITLEDCLITYSLRGYEAVISDGQISHFEKDGVRVED